MRQIVHLCAILALMCMGCVFAYAQGGYIVSGEVTDQLGPVVGASVIEQGTQNGTTTGLNGDFTLKVSGPEAVVEISCIGYAPQAFKASQLPKVVTMKEDAEFIDEVDPL